MITMATVPEALKPTVRKVTVDFLGNGALMSMDETGQLAEYQSPEEAVKKIKARDVKDGGFIVTLIEWRNPPAGFVAPT